MKKICLAVRDKDQNQSLLRLRELGVLHIEQINPGSEELTKAFEKKGRTENAMGLIQTYKAPKKKKNIADRGGRERRNNPNDRRRGRRSADKMGDEDLEPYSLDAVNAPVRPELTDYMMGMSKTCKELEDQMILLDRERSRIIEWGEFDPHTIKEINTSGFQVFLYEVNQDVFTNIPVDTKYIIIKQEKTSVRLAVFYSEIPGIAPFRLPDEPLSTIEIKYSELKEKKDEAENKIRSFADRRPVLEKEMDDILNDIDFESARAELINIDGTESISKISFFKGYIPAEDVMVLKETAAENNWALTLFDPEAEDIPPTKLKNNPVARLLLPLLTFLGTVPGYREFDVSPSYLFFLSIFFAMILGDAGYGVIVLVLALFLGIKLKKKSGVFPDVSKLIMILSFCTIAWGAINGSWFAIPHASLPPMLSAIIIPPFVQAGPVVEFPGFLQSIFKLPAEVPVDEFKARWNIQFLCFALAVTQLCWARGKKFLNELPSLAAFAQLGTLIMMLGLYFLVLNMLLGIPMPPFALYFIIAGVVLNLVFGEQKGGNFIINMVKGLKNFFSLFLKSVGCFADIISYIRLFAVGLAGAMIAQIFNDMALPGDGFGSFGLAFIIKIIAMVLVLAVGHVLNLALTALSIIVHGVRLNLLEYAGNHLEMEWSGYLYNPFALKRKK